MKIAVITDDAKTISAHFGHAQYYLVFSVENGKIAGQELRLKANDGHSMGKEHVIAQSKLHFSTVTHTSMMGTIIDCDVLLARGMDRAAYDDLRIRNIRPIITAIRDVQTAVDAFLTGNIIDYPERLE